MSGQSLSSNQGGAVEGWQIGDAENAAENLAQSPAESYEAYLASAFRPWADQLIERAGLSAGERVLDVACGTGIVARRAALRVGASGTVVGLDLNAGMLSVASRASVGLQPAIEWRQGSALELPFAAESFDAVFCQQALQFLSDPVAALIEVRRVLAPGGRVAANVCRPIACSPGYVALADALARHVGPDAAAIMRSPFPPWTVEGVRRLFADAGFAHPHVTIEPGVLRYSSAAEFLRREAASSPIAGAVSALDSEVRGRLIQELEASLADFRDDEGVVCAVPLYVAVARR